MCTKVKMILVQNIIISKRITIIQCQILTQFFSSDSISDSNSDSESDSNSAFMNLIIFVFCIL